MKDNSITEVVGPILLPRNLAEQETNEQREMDMA